MRVKLIVLLVLIITTFVWAKDENENILEKYMKDNNVSGTVVIKSLKSGKTNIYNKERSENKYLPASTFKIVNTLIALQEKIVKDENEIIKWNGKDYGMAVWNKDQNMKTAFATSCVWFYQELSKKIGLSPASTLERVKKLESIGVIESYHAKVSPQKVNLTISTFVLVNISWVKPKALESFIEKIQLIDEVTECYVITGDADVLLKVVCKDIQSYELLLFKKLSQIEEVERLKTLMNLSNVKHKASLPIVVE